MKVQLLLPLSVALTVLLLVLLKTRRQVFEKEERKSRFESMKLRVSGDVLTEYQTEKIDAQNSLSEAREQLKALEEQVAALGQQSREHQRALDECRGAQKTLGDGVAAAEVELKNLQDSAKKEKDGWTNELKTLKSKMDATSEVCGFLKKDLESASPFCPKKAEEPKAEAPQQVPKQEAPKPQPEAPKQEAPKPQPEVPKQEAPKPQPEAPKQEAPKA